MAKKPAGRQSKPISGAKVIVECLRMHGIKTVFGYPGGAVIPLYDELYRAKDIRHVLVRHEQGAAHMADAFSRVTGDCGVCIATSGPGATNLVTGLATAYMDSIPMVAFTGQVPTQLIGNDAFQEADVTGITRPITKHNFLVKDVDELALTIHEAFHIATTGKPGPVVIDVPKNVQLAMYDGDIDIRIDLPGYNPTFSGNIRQIERAAELINEAERPLFYIGGGAVTSNAHQEILKAVEKAGVPVTTTLMGLGAFPASHPNNLGMLGMHGTAYANYAVTNCDVLVAIGARFDDRVTGKLDAFSPYSKRIHIDIDPTSISKNVRADIPIVGDVRDCMKKMLRFLKPKDRSEWSEMIDTWRKKHPLEIIPDQLTAPYCIKELHRITKGKAIVAVDVGQHQMWTAQYYGFDKPRHCAFSGGLGTMGFGLPAGIGAAFAKPKEEVWVIAGDGGFMMNIQEMALLGSPKYPDLKVNIMLINNSWLGMVRQWQEMFQNKRYSAVDISDNPDFVELATAFGVKAERCEKMEDVEGAIKRARKHKRSYLIDFRVVKEENVYPMVPAGNAVNEMMFYPKNPELI